MRASGTIILFFVVSVAFTLGAVRSSVEYQEAIVTEADFAAAMEEMDYVSGDAELHIDAKYWGDLGTDTDAMKVLLEQVRTFWVAREVRGAIDFTEQALAATAALSRASGTGDGGQADQAFSDLSATCRSCHREFRERTEDGGYRIKPGG
jgi:hypothetical protein